MKSLAQTKSDPIAGSLGHPKNYGDMLTDPEIALEEHLRSLKPVEHTNDHDFDASEDSLAWAEKKVGAKYVLPSKEE